MRSALTNVKVSSGYLLFYYVFFVEKKIINPYILKILDFLPKYIPWADMPD